MSDGIIKDLMIDQAELNIPNAYTSAILGYFAFSYIMDMNSIYITLVSHVKKQNEIERMTHAVVKTNNHSS